MTRKANFFEWYSWIKFNNFGLALGMKFYIEILHKFSKSVSTFEEVTGEKLNNLNDPRRAQIVIYIICLSAHVPKSYHGAIGGLLVITRRVHCLSSYIYILYIYIFIYIHIRNMKAMCTVLSRL